MKYLNGYVNELLADGKYYFTRDDAMAVLGLSDTAFKFQAYRLAKKKSIMRLVCGFYMIIPVEYRHFGAIPPEWIIDPLMRYLGQDYYIGLLSAASMHGANHQAPMFFQVITTKKLRDIILSRVKIVFHRYKYIQDVVKTTRMVPTGYSNVASAEQTMIDVLRFYTSCGYMHNVATIIKDLAPVCSLHALEETCHNEHENALMQRLGFILELVGCQDLASMVEKLLSSRKIQYVTLIPGMGEYRRDVCLRWKIIVNDVLDIE